MEPRKIGIILTGIVAGIAGVYFFNSWRNGSTSAAPTNNVFEEGKDGEETY
jgi:hypothetical protein